MYGHDDFDGAATIPEKKLGFRIGSCKFLQQANIKLYLLLTVNFTISKLHWINFYIFWKRLFSILYSVYNLPLELILNLNFASKKANFLRNW